jgi:hypothetical protein
MLEMPGSIQRIFWKTLGVGDANSGAVIVSPDI